MGPATPSRFAQNEASWSGTPCSAGYEWTSEPPLAQLPGSPPPARCPLPVACRMSHVERTCQITSYESSLESDTSCSSAHTRRRLPRGLLNRPFDEVAERSPGVA